MTSLPGLGFLKSIFQVIPNKPCLSNVRFDIGNKVSSLWDSNPGRPMLWPPGSMDYRSSIILQTMVRIRIPKIFMSRNRIQLSVDLKTCKQKMRFFYFKVKNLMEHKQPFKEYWQDPDPQHCVRTSKKAVFTIFVVKRPQFVMII